MNFICILSGLNVKREKYLENFFDVYVLLYIYFISMYIYQY